MKNIRNIGIIGNGFVGVVNEVVRVTETTENGVPKGCMCQQSPGMMCLMCDDPDAQQQYNRYYKGTIDRQPEGL